MFRERDMGREDPESEYKRKTYYELLGVFPRASQEEIRDAFVKLSKLHHPDRGGDALRYKFISEAWATLKDADKRAQYDRKIQDRLHEPPAYGRRPAPHSTRHEESDIERDLREKVEEDLRRFYGRAEQAKRKMRDVIEETEEEVRKAEYAYSGRIRKDGIFYYIFDSSGRRISSGYDRIENRDGVTVGSIGSVLEYLLDPHTGEQLSNGYDRIENRNGIVVGRVGSVLEYLLDRRTGEQLSSGYDTIIVREGLVIGKSVFEYLLDRNTGEELSDGFNRIEKRGNRIVGKGYAIETVIA